MAFPPTRILVLALSCEIFFSCRAQIKPQNDSLPSRQKLSPAPPPVTERPNGEIKGAKAQEPYLVGLFGTAPQREEVEMAIRVFQLNRSSNTPAADTAWDPFLETVYAYLEQPAARLNLGTLVRARVAAEFELDVDRRKGRAPAALADAVDALLRRIDRKIELLRGERSRRQARTEPVDPNRPCWPLSYGLITSSFGPRRDPLEPAVTRFHGGIDLAAAPREPVLAILPGRVEAAGWAGNYGRMVRISHGPALESVYAHLELVLVKPGQMVSRGEVIGLLGSSGRTTGYHLHFELRREGKAVDPLTQLPQITFSYSDLLPGISFEVSE